VTGAGGFRGLLAGFGGEVVIFNFFVECIAIDTQPSGGAGLDPLTLSEDLQDEFFFDDVYDLIPCVVVVVSDFCESAADEFGAEGLEVIGGAASDANGCESADVGGEEVSGDFAIY
jgi:hypothetical protein